jgi:hypothetical protein
MANAKFYMGIDLGSVSLNIVVIDEVGDIKAAIYRCIDGRPLVVLHDSLVELGKEFTSFDGIIVTGSGRKLVGLRPPVIIIPPPEPSSKSVGRIPNSSFWIGTRKAGNPSLLTMF